MQLKHNKPRKRFPVSYKASSSTFLVAERIEKFQKLVKRKDRAATQLKDQLHQS